MINNRKIISSLVIIVSLISVSVAIRFIAKNRDRTENYAPLTIAVSPKRLKNPRCQKMNTEGLERLHAYGSGLINYNDFLPDYKGDMSKVYVVGLRPDETLYYYNNRSLMWYGLGYTDKTLGKTKKSFKKYIIRLIYGSPPIHDKTKLQTQADILQDLGAHYVTPLKNIDNWLTDLSYIDELIIFFENLPEDAIVYVHCQHGKGRTTAILVLYDIFENYKKVPLDDIIQRHYCLGREDLYDTTLWQANKWTQEALIARKNLAIRFYDYMKAPDGYLHQKWSQWLQKQNFDTMPIQIHQINKQSLTRQG